MEYVLLGGLVALGTVLGLQTLAADTGEGALTSACRLLQKVGLGAGGCGGGGDDDGAHADPDPRVDTDLALNREAHNSEEDIVVVREPDDRFAPRPPQMTSRHGLDEIIAAEQDARFRERFGVDLDLSEADLATLVGVDPALFGRDEEVAGIQVAQAVPSTVVPGAPLAEPVVPEFRPANPNTTGIRPGAAANLNRPPTMAPSALLRALRLTPMTALTLLHGSSGPFSRRLEHPDFDDVWFRLSESDGGYRLSAHQCRESGILRCTLPKRLGEVELYPLQDVLPPADFEVLGLPEGAFIDPNTLQVIDLTHARSMTEWDFHFHPETLFEGFTEPRASREGERVYVFVDPNRYEVHFDPDTWTVVIRDKETGAEVPESEVTGGWLAPDGSVWSSREGGVRLDGGPGADVVVADGAATMSAGPGGTSDPPGPGSQEEDGEPEDERAAARAAVERAEIVPHEGDWGERTFRLKDGEARIGSLHIEFTQGDDGNAHMHLAIEVDEAYRGVGASERLLAEVRAVVEAGVEGLGPITAGTATLTLTNNDVFSRALAEAQAAGMDLDDALRHAFNQTPTGRRWADWGFEIVSIDEPTAEGVIVELRRSGDSGPLDKGHKPAGVDGSSSVGEPPVDAATIIAELIDGVGAPTVRDRMGRDARRWLRQFDPELRPLLARQLRVFGNRMMHAGGAVLDRSELSTRQRRALAALMVAGEEGVPRDDLNLSYAERDALRRQLRSISVEGTGRNEVWRLTKPSPGNPVLEQPSTVADVDPADLSEAGPYHVHRDGWVFGADGQVLDLTAYERHIVAVLHAHGDGYVTVARLDATNADLQNLRRFRGLLQLRENRGVRLSPETACFVAGTPVHTAKGTKSIEEIRAGDLVWARDEETGAQSLKAVLGTKVTHRQRVLEITLRGERSEEALGVTKNHPFFVPGRGFVKAEQLKLGDRIATLDQDSLEVTEIVELAARATVYNFAVEDFHTYFVGFNAAWVHNDNCVYRGPPVRVLPPGSEPIEPWTTDIPRGMFQDLIDLGPHNPLAPILHHQLAESLSELGFVVEHDVDRESIEIVGVAAGSQLAGAPVHDQIKWAVENGVPIPIALSPAGPGVPISVPLDAALGDTRDLAVFLHDGMDTGEVTQIHAFYPQSIHRMSGALVDEQYALAYAAMDPSAGPIDASAPTPEGMHDMHLHRSATTAGHVAIISQEILGVFDTPDLTAVAADEYGLLGGIAYEVDGTPFAFLSMENVEDGVSVEIGLAGNRGLTFVVPQRNVDPTRLIGIVRQEALDLFRRDWARFSRPDDGAGYAPPRPEDWSGQRVPETPSEISAAIRFYSQPYRLTQDGAGGGSLAPAINLGGTTFVYSNGVFLPLGSSGGVH